MPPKQKGKKKTKVKDEADKINKAEALQKKRDEAEKKKVAAAKRKADAEAKRKEKADAKAEEAAKKAAAKETIIEEMIKFGIFTRADYNAKKAEFPESERFNAWLTSQKTQFNAKKKLLTLETQVKAKDDKIENMKDLDKTRAKREAEALIKQKELSKEKEMRIDQLKERSANEKKKAEEDIQNLNDQINKLMTDVSGRDTEILELARLKTEREKQFAEYSERAEQRRQDALIREAQAAQNKKELDELAVKLKAAEEMVKTYKDINDQEMAKRTAEEVESLRSSYSVSLSNYDSLLESDKSIRESEAEEMVFEDDVFKAMRSAKESEQQSTGSYETPQDKYTYHDESLFTEAKYFETAGPKTASESFSGGIGSGTSFGSFGSFYTAAPAGGATPPPPPAGGATPPPPPPEGGEDETADGGAAGGYDQNILRLIAAQRKQKEDAARLMRLKGARNIDSNEMFNEIDKQKMLRAAIAKETYNQGVQSIINKSLYDASQRNQNLKREYDVQRRTAQISRNNALF